MLPLLKYKKETIVFAGDLIPTIGHIPVPYIMGYDKVLKHLKKNPFSKALKQLSLFMEHDLANELIFKKNRKRCAF